MNTATPTAGKKTLASSYQNMKGTRSPYLTRAEEYARATIPHLMPDSDNTGGDSMQSGWQSFGAKVVNHLSNKIIMTLFPPSRSFFKLSFSSSVEAEMQEAGWDSSRLASQLAAIEADALTYMDKTTPRDLDIKTAKHLIVTGNYLHYFPDKEKKAIGISMDQYVVSRDAHGKLLEVIIEQKKALGAMPAEVKDAIMAEKKNSHLKTSEEIKLYTGAKLKDDGKYEIYQEALGNQVGDKYRLKEDRLPFTVLMWQQVDGEDYGRGLVEDYAGDFHVIQILSESIAKGMILMSDIKYLVKPGSYTDVDHLTSSPTGEFINGNIDDIGVLQLEKYADFSPIIEVLNSYEQRIGEAFMVSRAARREAERVTAYEIRQDAADLETSLGGVYSHLSSIWQKPRAQILLKLTLDNSPAALTLDDFEPEIITGTEALGRMNELDKIMQFTEMLQMTNAWPETMQKRVRWDSYSAKVAAEIGLEIDWIMSDEEFSKLQQQEQKSAMQQNAMAEASKAAPDIIKQAAGGGNE